MSIANVGSYFTNKLSGINFRFMNLNIIAFTLIVHACFLYNDNVIIHMLIFYRFTKHNCKLFFIHNVILKCIHIKFLHEL